MTGSSRRSRDLAVLITIAGAILVAAVTAGVIALRDRDADGVEEPEDTPTLDVPAAVVEENFNDACAALVEAGIDGKRAKAPASADQADLFGQYGEDGTGAVVGIGLTVCEEGWVIVAGVESADSVVPSVGPRGTPVVAYVQPPFVAN